VRVHLLVELNSVQDNSSAACESKTSMASLRMGSFISDIDICLKVLNSVRPRFKVRNIFNYLYTFFRTVNYVNIKISVLNLIIQYYPTLGNFGQRQIYLKATCQDYSLFQRT